MVVVERGKVGGWEGEMDLYVGGGRGRQRIIKLSEW